MLDRARHPAALESVPFGDLIDGVSTCNPTLVGLDLTFTHIDLCAIDQEKKTITAARHVLGAEAPSRARQVVKTGDVIVSTVRPNLNGVAVVTD